MVRLVGLALGASLCITTMAWGQGPRNPGQGPTKPGDGNKDGHRPPPEQRHQQDQRWHHRQVIGWPYWFGYPVVYVDPFGFPVGTGVTPYQYGFAYPSPLVGSPAFVPPPNPMPKDEPVPEPKPAVKPKVEPKPRDELDRRADVQKLIRVGNDAFAQGDYAKAAKSYQQATDSAPLEPMGFFHLAQAQLAQGKFAEAGISIQRGLMLKPDWPDAPFDARSLYGETPGHFDRHLALLAELVAKNKNDDGLLFLLGYELWFDGKKDEARVLFKRAAALTLNPLHVERFLKGKA